MPHQLGSNLKSLIASGEIHCMCVCVCVSVMFLVIPAGPFGEVSRIQTKHLITLLLSDVSDLILILS